MHLVFVFPRLKTFSGAENLLLELSSRARAAGHRVTVVTRRVDGSCRGLFHPDVRVRVAPLPFRLLTGVHLADSFFDTAFAPVLAPLIPARADVVCYVGPPTLPVLWTSRVAFRRRTPAAYYCLQPPRFAYDLLEETVAANGLLGRLAPLVAILYRAADRRLVHRADRVFAISRAYAAWCRELYDLPEVGLLYPGVDVRTAPSEPADAVRRALGVPRDALLVLTANKLIARKNVDVFLKAMKLAAERVPAAHGVVVGGGPLEGSLRRLSSRLGLDGKVTFTGFLPRFGSVLDLMGASDVYVFLERNVPFGLTVLEAGLCRRPVVAVRGGGTEDTVVDGATGYLVDADPLRAEDVAERIGALLIDPERRSRFGANGLRHAQRYSLEATSMRFVEALEALAGADR